jgi:hypothetical protein
MLEITSHTYLIASVPVMAAGLVAGVIRHKNIDQLTSQIDEELACTLHRLVANGASEWEMSRAVGGVWGVLRLLRQAGLHLSIINELNQTSIETSKAQADLAEAHFLALWEALIAKRDSLTRPALRRVVECYCIVTRVSDEALNEMDATW